MSVERTRISYTPAPPILPAQARSVSLLVCSRARDIGDARDLLGVLGLVEVGAGAPTGQRVPNAPVPSACRDCGRALRPGKRLAADYPGTVGHAGRGRCRACWEKTRATA